MDTNDCPESGLEEQEVSTSNRRQLGVLVGRFMGGELGSDVIREMPAEFESFLEKFKPISPNGPR